jgi:hypothetical protein
MEKERDKEMPKQSENPREDELKNNGKASEKE